MMTQSSGWGLSVLGLTLGLAIIGGSYIVGHTVKEIHLANRTIDVKGYAELDVVSDLGKWTFTIKSRATTLEDAHKKLKNDKKVLLNYLAEMGISDESIEFSAAYTNELMKNVTAQNYSYQTNEVEFYEARQLITVQNSDVYKIKEAAEKSGSLAEKGISLEGAFVEFYCTKIADIKTDLLGEATQNAVLRAEQLAKYANSKVGRLQSARQGVFQITPEYSTDVSDYGVSDTSSIRKKAKSVATVSFSIEK